MGDNLKFLKDWCFQNLRLEEKDIEFLRMYTDKNLTPLQLAKYFDSIDFEALGGQQVCALAALAKRLDYRGVPKALYPRIRGIVRYYTMMNIGQMHEFYRFLKICNQNGIDVLLMKGGAMKAYYKPSIFYYMGDVDCCIRYEDFDKVCTLFQKLPEYKSFISMPHLVVEREKYIVEAHGFFLKENLHKNNEQKIWEEVIPAKLQEEKVLIPVPELMLISILTNIFGDSVKGHENKSLRWMRWITDTAIIVEEHKVDWDKFMSFCRMYNITLQVKVMLMIFDEILPGVIPGNVIEELEVDEIVVRKIPVMLGKSKAYMKSRIYRGEKNIRFAWQMAKHHWFHHRYVSERFCLLTDILTFPNYIKRMWGCCTWREWIVKVVQRIKNPKIMDSL